MQICDETEVYGLKRCITCGDKLIRACDQNTLRKHVGHRLKQPGHLHVLEAIRIKLGLL